MVLGVSEIELGPALGRTSTLLSGLSPLVPGDPLGLFSEFVSSVSLPFTRLEGVSRRVYWGPCAGAEGILFLGHIVQRG